MSIESCVLLFCHSGLFKTFFGEIKNSSKWILCQIINILTRRTPASDQLDNFLCLDRVWVSSLQFRPTNAMLKCSMKLSAYDRCQTRRPKETLYKFTWTKSTSHSAFEQRGLWCLCIPHDAGHRATWNERTASV